MVRAARPTAGAADGASGESERSKVHAAELAAGAADGAVCEASNWRHMGRCRRRRWHAQGGRTATVVGEARSMIYGTSQRRCIGLTGHWSATYAVRLAETVLGPRYGATDGGSDRWCRDNRGSAESGWTFSRDREGDSCQIG